MPTPAKIQSGFAPRMRAIHYWIFVTSVSTSAQVSRFSADRSAGCPAGIIVQVVNEFERLLADQRGLATRDQLMELGLSRRTIDRRSEAGGRWQRVLPGIIASFTGQLTPRQRLQAAVLWGGPEAALGAGTAAEIHGLRYVPEEVTAQVHLLVPYGGGRVTNGFVAVRHAREMPPVWVRDRLAVVPPARAVVDACRCMPSFRDVRALVAEVVQRRLTTADRLEDEVRRGGSAGSQLVRMAVEELRAGVRSAPEAEARALVRASGLPEPLWNHDLYTPTGEWIARPDGWWAEGVAFEADSREYHLGPDEWETTMRRHERMSAYGIIVVHASPTRISRHGTELAEHLGAALTAAGRRDPPDVVALPPGTLFVAKLGSARPSPQKPAA